MKMYAAIWITISFLAVSVSAALASGCEAIDFEEQPFSVCTVSTTTHVIGLALNDDDAKRIGTFERLEEHLGDKADAMAFAMNAGMYHPDRRPVGLYVEDGQEITRIVTRDGPGNFGLLPNGLLCIGDDGVQIIESREFAKSSLSCEFATQSGPMLVIDGQLHPRFLSNSDSKFIRNGVGIDDQGNLIAAISDRPVNFHTFGRLFRDHLKTPDALFLDGRISRLYAPAIGRRDFGFPMGPILYAIERDN